jgi:hypothetical protein
VAGVDAGPVTRRLLDPGRLQPHAVAAGIREPDANVAAADRRERKPRRAPALPVEHAAARADEGDIEIAGRLVGDLRLRAANGLAGYSTSTDGAA